jgi:hypothetical protein
MPHVFEPQPIATLAVKALAPARMSLDREYDALTSAHGEAF